MVYTELNDFNVYNLPAFKKFQLCIVTFHPIYFFVL